MSVSHKIKMFTWGVIAMLSLSSCNGIFEGIYDKPISKKEYGFIHIDPQTNQGTIYIDATDYKQWHYINLNKKETISTLTTEEAPSEWDFAIHRYDVKTNGGAVAEINVTDFNSLPPISSIPDGQFIEDEWTTNRITIDMSQMMDGIILYAEDYYNPCMSKWLNVDTSTMPPIYTLSGKVYILRCTDGTYAALRLRNFMNDAATKGYMTIDYYYPIER